MNYSTLTELEHKTFSELNRIAGRFSNVEEDLKKYPGVYYTEEELRAKVIETQKKLEQERIKAFSTTQ